LFPGHVFYIVKYVSVRGVSDTVNEMFAHMDTHLSNTRICGAAMSRIPWFTVFISENTWG
jgi:hypothetical protein